MKTLLSGLLTIAALTPAGLLAQPGGATTQSRLAALAARVERQPDNFQARLELTGLQIRRYRETGDLERLREVRQSLDEFQRQFPQHFTARKLDLEILLIEERFAEAEPLAVQMNKEVPDDRDTYGYLATLAVRRGDYADAEKQVQWMLNLRKDEVAGRWKAIELREDFGEVDGALHLLSDVFGRIPGDDPFERARLLALGARIARDAGRPELAAQYDAQVQKLWPGFRDTPPGPESAAWQRAVQQVRNGAAPAALAFMEQSPRRDVRARLMYAEALTAAGRTADAKAQLAIVKKIGYQTPLLKELEAKTE